MTIRILILFIITNCFGIIANGQMSKLDSLRSVLKYAKQDTAKARIYHAIGYQHNLRNPDSAIYFYNKVIQLTITKTNNNYSQYLCAKALQAIGWENINFKEKFDTAQIILNKAFSIYSAIVSDKKLEDKVQKGIAGCYTYFGIIQSYKGNFDIAIEYYLKSLKIFEKLNEIKKIPSCFGNIGNIYRQTGKFDMAIEYFIKALKIFETLKDKNGISSCYTNIGIIYEEQENYNKAIEYYLKSLKFKKELGDKVSISTCYNNLCITYKNMGNYDMALKYCYMSLKISEELGNKLSISSCYGNLGNLNIIKKNYVQAIENLTKSLQINEELGNIEGVSLVLGNISFLHLSIAESDSISFDQKQYHYKEAIHFGQKSIGLAKKAKATLRINEAAKHLLIAYKALGNSAKALEFAEIFISTKDSMFGNEKTKALAEMETKYQTEKKQLAIGKLEKEKELQSSEMKKQRLIIIFVICGLLLVLGFAVVLFRLFIQKKKTNKIIIEKNEALQMAFEEINTQKEEIIVQRDSIQEQKDIIEEHHKEITDSINYAKRIQQAMLPDFMGILKDQRNLILKNPTSNIQDFFVLFKPKDVVSGDFYWATHIDKMLIITLADCTGHGVPGAFMSMLGISFLNEIVRKKEITKAAEVLDQLRTSVIEALKQKNKNEEHTSTDHPTNAEQGLMVQDGMDIALCAINLETLEMQFAGANNPCWIIRNVELDILNVELEKYLSFKIQNSKFYELKGDKMPIGIHDRMNPFENHTYQLQKGDTIYLMSDGYEDQFGGSNRKKFLSKNLKNLLIANCQLPIADQKELLETTINKWIGNGEQIDDITIMGIRI